MVRIVLAEDVALLRQAIREVLELRGDITVVAEVAAGDEVAAAVAEHRPDVAVLDIELPGRDGISAAAELARTAPDCKVLILTGLGRPSLLRRALDAGAAGFITKDLEPDTLADAIVRVAAGEQVVDPRLALAALKQSPSPLRPRETDVLRAAATGAEIEEIAARLALSAGTVRNYLTACIAKLDARNRVDAIRIATELGLI
jgi:two-component system response regulator DesR